MYKLSQNEISYLSHIYFSEFYKQEEYSFEEIFIKPGKLTAKIKITHSPMPTFHLTAVLGMAIYQQLMIIYAHFITGYWGVLRITQQTSCYKKMIDNNLIDIEINITERKKMARGIVCDFVGSFQAGKHTFNGRGHFRSIKKISPR